LSVPAKQGQVKVPFVKIFFYFLSLVIFENFKTQPSQSAGYNASIRYQLVKLFVNNFCFNKFFLALLRGNTPKKKIAALFYFFDALTFDYVCKDPGCYYVQHTSPSAIF
jgi:hypothetical protein